MYDREARVAAESLLRSHEGYNSQIQSPADISHSQSINTIPSIRPEYVISEALFAGQRPNGRMSSVRRFFCLFVTFDVLFTSLMWLICIMLTGENIMVALKKEIYHYSINTSLFDIVVVAIFRFFILIFFYAILYINHWIVIALSTTFTCAFLISKVFVFNWQPPDQPVFQVLLVLISFILSWGEAWFLDFRVIPQEYHATSPDSERAPLIRSYVQGLPSMYTESVGNFYSPMGSPQGSVHRFDPGRCSYASMRLSQDQQAAYKSRGEQILAESWGYLNSANWVLHKENQDNDVIHSMTLPKIGKIFKLTGVVEIPPRYLLDELFYRVENIPHWNPSLLESHIVQSIDEYTDICYQVSTDGAAGAITSRDFVSLRHWGLLDGCYVLACTATEHPSAPENKKYIRAENGVGCMVMRPIAADKNCCEFQWVFNTNLKGWIPTYILDPAYVKMMFDYIKSLRKLADKLGPSGSIS